MRKNQPQDFAPASSDNLEYATPEGSLAWVILNTRIGLKLNDHLKVNFSIENIADIHYRPFSSGISQPGRNFVISCLKNFNG